MNPRSCMVKGLFSILLVGCIVGESQASLWDIWDNDEPVDCSVSHWQPWSECRNVSAVDYERKRTRVLTPAENGGNECESGIELIDKEECEVTGAIADLVLAQVMSGSLRRTHGDEKECREWRDSSGKLIASGGDCSKSGIAKRSIRSDFETIVKRIRRQSTSRNRDILFLLDESGSVQQHNFETVKKIAAAFVDNFCGGATTIATHQTRISVASFDSNDHVHFYLNNEFMDNGPSMVEKILEISYNKNGGKSTCLVEALRHAHSNIFTKLRGARLDRNEYEQQIILISDGCANCDQTALPVVRDELYGDNISILTILIGSDSNCVATIKQLASDERCWEFFSLESWSMAQKFAQMVKKKSCKTNFSGVGVMC